MTTSDVAIIRRWARTTDEVFAPAVGLIAYAITRETSDAEKVKEIAEVLAGIPVVQAEMIRRKECHIR